MLYKIIILYCFLSVSSALSHGGRTISKGELKGCHNNNQTKTFHCHGHSRHSLNEVEFSSKQEVLSLVSESTEINPKKKAKYSRKKFKHWTDVDKNCLNTRAEILKNRSLREVVIRKCRVRLGQWKDYYYDETLVNASDIDIDHIVPLKEAWVSGANLWNDKEREVFANDPENLVITNFKYNRKKVARTPLEWLPINKNYACRYIHQWLSIKEKYQLKVSSVLLVKYKSMNCP